MVPGVTSILQCFLTEYAALLPPAAMLAMCREIGDTAWRDRGLMLVTPLVVFTPVDMAVPAAAEIAVILAWNPGSQLRCRRSASYCTPQFHPHPEPSP